MEINADDPRIQKAFNRIQQILDTHVLDQPDHNPLQECAFIEILIRLDGILEFLSQTERRISFIDDVNLFASEGKKKHKNKTDSVKDITDAVHQCRAAACHILGDSQFADSQGRPKQDRRKPTADHYYVEFNPAWGKGLLFDSPHFKLESSYNDDVCIFYGAHRLYLKRHIIRALQEAKEKLGV